MNMTTENTIRDKTNTTKMNKNSKQNQANKKQR